MQEMRLWFIVAAVCIAGCGGQELPVTGPQAQDACVEGVETEKAPLADDVCECIVAADERPFSPGVDQSGVLAGGDAGTRAMDPSLSHWKERIRSTRCGCCHNAQFEGPGSFYWDLAYEPVWLDSVTDERLLKMAGQTEQQTGAMQSLTFDDAEMAEFAAFVQEELTRREQARNQEGVE